jgi:hypothetical protein
MAPYVFSDKRLGKLANSVGEISKASKGPKVIHSTFRVKEVDGIGERTGYVLGQFAAHKEKYNWVITHLRTGLKGGFGGWIEKKAEAIETLKRLEREEFTEQEHLVLRILESVSDL